VTENENYRVEVSIIIVSMKTLENLTECLDSIYQSAHNILYEVLVVTYLYDDNMFKMLTERYPWIRTIRNNSIAGFSENNNKALRIARGKYCIILNDDTYFFGDFINEMLSTFKLFNDEKIAILSPIIYFPDGRVQYDGRNKSTYIDFILNKVKLGFLERKNNKPQKNDGIYQTYNISGACFMIKTSLFRELGFFDEKYFFCPEDIALSTKINKKGYKVMVNSSLKIFHIHKSTSNKLLDILLPVEELGSCMFYSNGHKMLEYILRLFIFFQACLKLFYWIVNILGENRSIKIKAYWNVMLYIFSGYTTKELFTKLYLSNKKEK